MRLIAACAYWTLMLSASCSCAGWKFRHNKTHNVRLLVLHVIYGNSGCGLETHTARGHIGIDMVPSIIDVWGYDREFCSYSSSSSPSPSD